MIEVLVVDDQAMVRIGIGAILDAQDDLSVVGEAPDGRRALELNRQLRPDVVLLDVRMPVMDGLETVRRLLDESSVHRPRVLMLTTFNTDEHVYEALRAGATGFLLKDSEPAALVAAVREVAHGDAALAPEVTRRVIERFVDGAGVAALDPVALEVLTDREREVLRLVALGRTNAEIARSLYIAEQTTKSHVSRILHKLHLRDRAQAVVLGYETGLVVPGAH